MSDHRTRIFCQFRNQLRRFLFRRICERIGDGLNGVSVNLARYITAQNAAEAVDKHMQDNRIQYVSRFDVYISEKQSYGERIEKLREVSVHKPECESRGEYRRFFSERAYSVDKKFTEDQLFDYRSGNYHDD